MRALLERARALDPSTWVLLLAILVRVDTALRFDPVFGYDALAHFAYVDYLAIGHLPRVGQPDLGFATTTSPHPPMFYLLALAFEKLGFGRHGGTIVSLIAGTIRLVLADRLLARWMSPRARLFANVVHGFIPFALRLDVFYSNECVAATFALAAVYLALEQRALASGLALGAAFLSKATTVAAVPAVIAALLCEDRFALRLERVRALAIAGAISALMLLPWAWPNLVRFGRPFVSAYHPEVIVDVKKHPEAFEKPIFARHAPEWYLPRFEHRDLLEPYAAALTPRLPNGLYLEAWADYYDYLRPGSGAIAAHDRSGPRVLAPTHIALAHLGLFFVAAMLIGGVDAARRARRREVTRAELAVALFGAGYALIAITFAIWVPFDAHGAVKASYALGAVVILSAWTGRGLELVARTPARALAWTLVTALVAVTFWQRILW